MPSWTGCWRASRRSAKPPSGSAAHSTRPCLPRNQECEAGPTTSTPAPAVTVRRLERRRPRAVLGAAGPSPLLPSEDRLLEPVDRVTATFKTQPSELQQHPTRRRMNEVIAQRDLHHRTRTFRDADEPRRILTL